MSIYRSLGGNSLHHFILTRFNLLLWNKDKEGQKVRSTSWLEHRFGLFEKYCLPSISNQTKKDFDWIVLFDSTTPDRFKERIKTCQLQCPKLIPIFVKPEDGRFFAQIFKNEVLKRLHGERVITTYLDNDDSLDVRFVEDLHSRAESLPDGTFINYTNGYQFYTDQKYIIRVNYPRNHFMSVVESRDSAELKTIYGFGSHYYIEKIEGVRIERVTNKPMWCEVIHERNMGNDAYFLFGTRMVFDKELLQKCFAVEEAVNSSLGLYLFSFIPRYIKTLFRRIGYFLLGRHW